MALIVLCHSVSKRDHNLSVNKFIFPNNMSENGAEQKETPLAASVSIFAVESSGEALAYRSHASTPSFRYAKSFMAILAKLLWKFRQKRRPVCVTIASGLVALKVHWVAIPAAYLQLTNYGDRFKHS